jgi:PKD repeat protein
MTSTNAFIAYRGLTSGCNHNSEAIACNGGEQLAMAAAFFQYNFTCATHTYTWDFGDGSEPASGQEVNHAYAAQGTYTAKVTISNGQQTFIPTMVIRVGNNTPGQGSITPDFSVDHDSLNTAQVTFTPSVDPATTSVTKVAWDFGDGSQLTNTGSKAMSAVKNTYTRSGIYTVTMTLTPTTGAVVVKTKQVTISAPSRSRGVRH